MPLLRKEALSRYVATSCKRQLRLYLSPDTKAYVAERDAQGMPPVQAPRPGLQAIREAGEEWGRAKVADLAATFGAAAIVGAPVPHPSGQTRYRPIPLETAIADAAPGKFLVEAEYTIGPAFEAALGIAAYREQFRLDYTAVRPDLVEVCPPGQFARLAQPDGDVADLPAGDGRLQLRVIDVKLTAAPSPPYFAEVTLYTMALAGWLRDRGLADRFVVVPDGAVWPGSHEASHLTREHRRQRDQGGAASLDALRAALAEDLERVPFEAFAFRLQRFFRDELPAVLAQPWQQLGFHVDNRCKGCEFLGDERQSQGQPTADPDHCMPTALRLDHLSRVAFVSRGASAALQDQGIASVGDLARRAADDPAFDAHQELRATRTVVAGRAAALQTQQAHVPPAAGTSAVMPRWADLRLYLSADFDLGSAITIALGLHAFWLQPLPLDAPPPPERHKRQWADVFVVDLKSLDRERDELLAFLRRIEKILTEAHGLDASTTVQFYLWDTLQYEHLTRIVGRHLEAILADRAIQNLAWLFPPEELLPNAALATRRSPITVVRDVIRAVLAVPIPHYYTLLETARRYHAADLPESVARFSVHPLFEDVLSDQVPSERAHEVWSRATTPHHWRQQMDTLVETVQRRLSALSAVTQQLETDLRPWLRQSAPPINLGPPPYKSGVSLDGQLWYAFAKLDDALADLEVHRIRAMPPHEREARFHSARLAERLCGPAEAAALAQLAVPAAPGRRVYRLRPGSREVRLRPDDFNVALACEGMPGFLDQSFRRTVEGTWLEPTGGPDMRARLEDVLGVSVAALDRDAGLIALEPTARYIRTDPDGRRLAMPDALEALGLADFGTDAILDPTHHDFFTSRLLKALQAIGNPPAASANPLVARAIGQAGRRGARATKHVPPADLLWAAARMAETPVTRDLAPARAALGGAGLDLNASQWQAWERALSRRLQLIWGPPGTGKSRTVTAVILGAALAAAQEARPLRVLLCAFTYTAIDNVLLPLYELAATLLPAVYFSGIARLRSYLARADAAVPAAIDVELNARQPSKVARELRKRLAHPTETLIVGATPGQVHNLLALDDGPAQAELFDLIVIDEASQMDVAHAVLPLCGLATGGSVVLAGDAKQLPPIHAAEPPRDLETMVGSIYTFCERQHGVAPLMLDQNYRSNATLVAFARTAGYRDTLVSYSPDLRLDLVAPLPAAPPANWPASLYWTPAWSTLLDPERPAGCFVYPDGRSSQSNPFEADAVVALAWLLHGRLARQLRDERDPTSGRVEVPAVRAAAAPAEFWERCLGIVTPHRAQQGLVVGRLGEVFAGTGVAPASLRGAVDTVERFQGQQRDVILASFALGDPDAIFDEDAFLLSLNRFNVLASRARAKLIVLISQEVVDHLSGDLDTLHASRLLKLYVNSFCRHGAPMQLGHLVHGAPRLVEGVYRYR